ncbi:hypothetical protein LUW77_03620 [Streptomyces radiopugnans]|nr:hypothetical protein LUW77_03620 [Streptomyces radiopugnans]
MTYRPYPSPDRARRQIERHQRPASTARVVQWMPEHPDFTPAWLED